MAFGRQFPGQRDHKYILNNVEIISAEAVDVVKMLCMCLLFWIVNILLLNYTEALSHTGPYMWVNAKYSYPCMFKYYRTNYFLEKNGGLKMWLCSFFFVFTRCAETLENLEINNNNNYLYYVMVVYNNNRQSIIEKSMDMFSCSLGLEVTHQNAVREFPDSIPGSCRDCLCLLICVAAVVFLLFCPKTLFTWFFCNSFCNVISFFLTYCKNCDRF